MNTKVFSAIALFALSNGALINMIMASRLMYGMAAQGIVPRQLGRVHGGRRTPWVAIVFVAALTVACLGLIVYQAFEDAVIFAYAGGLIVLGVALWGVTRALTGPAEPVDPTTLVD
jgi:APA family basic amino acid/polyamine antiporter